MGRLPTHSSSGDVTIADVAERAGVSIRTVSRVLNRSRDVNEQTCERVQTAIRDLNFRPNARARGLATGRSFLIGLVHADRNALVLDSVQRGIVSEAAVRGYDLVVHPAPIDEEGALEDVMDFVRRSQVDGLIVPAPAWSIPGLDHALTDAGVPVVALSSVALEGFPATLVSNEREAAAQVARHFVELGHRHIAFLSGPANVHSARERRAGFVASLAEAGRGLIGEAEGDYGFDSGVAGANRLLDLDPAPTSIFAANDIMAAGVLKVASLRGLAVPRDLSVVGFDGSILARMLSPALSTVHRPLGEMARRATACLIDLVEVRPTETVLSATLTFVPGESSGPAPVRV